MNSLSSLADLANRRTDELRSSLRGVFELELVTSAAMHMSDRAWAETNSVMRAPRASVERQQLVIARDVPQGFEALVNSLRSRRVAPPTPAPAVESAIAPDAGKDDCAWCRRSGSHVSQPDLSYDEFGAVYAANGRVRGGPNWARQAPVSGVVFGDEQMHDLFTLSRPDFRALFEAAELYVAKACAALPNIQFYEVFINGGARSAASVKHAHAQVAGRGDRHFAYPEAIAARAPGTYWDTVRAVHEDLGLAVDFAGGIAWANLVPAKERDITGFSTTLPDGADMMHSILQALMRRGTNSFSLAAILAPGYASGREQPERFRNWPPVVWRLVDRGDVRTRHADIGCLELFGSGVVASDPFEVASWLFEVAFQ